MRTPASEGREGCQHSFFFVQSAAAASLSGHAACNECSAERLSIAEIVPVAASPARSPTGLVVVVEGRRDATSKWGRLALK